MNIKTNKLGDKVVLSTDELSTIGACIRRAIEFYTGEPVNFTATDSAPDNYNDLINWHENKKKGEALPVFNGSSEKTIWIDPELNYLMRAFHDHVHIGERYTFSLDDEIKTANMQINILKSIGAPYMLLKLIKADLIGQIKYYNMAGDFVDDQAQFVSDCYNTSIKHVMDCVTLGMRY